MKKAFTIIELLFVIIILSIIAATLADKSKIKISNNAKEDIGQFIKEIQTTKDAYNEPKKKKDTTEWN